MLKKNWVLVSICALVMVALAVGVPVAVMNNLTQGDLPTQAFASANRQDLMERINVVAADEIALSDEF